MRSYSLPSLAAVCALAVSHWSAGASATTICVGPLEPLCVERESTYRNPTELSACRAAIASFVRATERYAACLDRQAAEVRDASKRIQEAFDRRLGKSPQGGIGPATPPRAEPGMPGGSSLRNPPRRHGVSLTAGS